MAAAANQDYGRDDLILVRPQANVQRPKGRAQADLARRLLRW